MNRRSPQHACARRKGLAAGVDISRVVIEHYRTYIAALFLALLVCMVTAGCRNVIEHKDVRPLVMHDVPAQRLAYRFEADTSLPADSKTDDSTDKAQAIQNDFNTRRRNDALVRTVVSPDGQRVLALYGTAAEPSEAFRIDLYSPDGKFLRNLTPPELAGAFPLAAAWSPDGEYITFIAHRNPNATASPTPLEEIEIAPSPSGSPSPLASPSIAPKFAPVPLFVTEQIYFCNRDGYELKPLTAREGLIYFYFAWAPDNHALAALACKEDEWNAREKQYKLPAGRPRLLTLDGKERLLDDRLTDTLPVWSPDSSKVATAFEMDVGIYDGATNAPTQARIPLRDALLAASISYDQRSSGSNKQSDTKPASQADYIPASFLPIVKLEWPAPEKLYLQTAYVRLGPFQSYTFQRWHLLSLSAQAAILK
jgi:WD40-like Beta Propeller Repeat